MAYMETGGRAGGRAGKKAPAAHAGPVGRRAPRACRCRRVPCRGAAPPGPLSAQVEEGGLEGGYGGVQAGDCVVAFSRKDIYAIKQLIEQVGFGVACRAHVLGVRGFAQATCAGTPAAAGQTCRQSGPPPPRPPSSAGDQAPRVRGVRRAAARDTAPAGQAVQRAGCVAARWAHYHLPAEPVSRAALASAACVHRLQSSVRTRAVTAPFRCLIATLQTTRTACWWPATLWAWGSTSTSAASSSTRWPSGKVRSWAGGLAGQ